MFRREHLYAIGLCDRPVPASQRVGWGALLNGILNPGISLVSGLSRRGLIGLDVDGEAVTFFVEHGRRAAESIGGIPGCGCVSRTHGSARLIADTFQQNSVGAEFCRFGAGGCR